MRNIKSDVYNTIKLIRVPFWDGIDNIYRPYFNTNEKLDVVYSIAGIKDKDVLCVQASTDHMFKCIENDAKSIDTFDINYLAKYFYYLKKNYLLAFNKNMDGSVTKDELYYVLKCFDTTNKDEEEAYNFWSELFPLISLNDFFSLFYICPNYLDYDIEKIKYIIKNLKLNFHLINVFENAFINDKKYDVVILSNIFESTGILSKSHELLKRIVNPYGEIICSNLATFNVNEHSIYERAKMEEYFYYDKGITVIEDNIPYQIAYKYIKK